MNASLNEETRKFESQFLLNIKTFTEDFPLKEPEDVAYMDVSPNQIVSVAASLIPFLEHDGANRALMGSNIQRQAVPLLRPQAPIVGTGLERRAALDSRAVIVAEGDGQVHYVDAKKVVIRYDWDEKQELVSFQDNLHTYHLTKFQRKQIKIHVLTTSL